MTGRVRRPLRTWGRMGVRSGALLVASVMVLTAAAGSATAALARPQTWSTPAAIPSALSGTAQPGLAAYDGDLYAAWMGESSKPHLWYSAFNGTSWSAQAEIPGTLTTSGPALAVYDGDLYAAWVGESSPYHIWYSDFNGATWSAHHEVPSALTVGPDGGTDSVTVLGLAAYSGKLYFAWLGAGSASRIWYSAFNGTSWTPQATIPGATGFNLRTGDGVALAAGNLGLYASWILPGTDLPEEYSTFNGASWTTPAAISSTCPQVGAALALVGTDLYDVWDDCAETIIGELGYNLVGYSVLSGTTWSSEQYVPQAYIPIAMNAGPAVAAYDGQLYVAWLPDQTSAGSGSPVDYEAGP
jgi:hypothetical protein